MTAFADMLVKWALSRSEPNFTEADVKARFRDVCTRKRRATLLGLVVNGTLIRSTKEDGSHIYYLSELTVKMPKH